MNKVFSSLLDQKIQPVRLDRNSKKPSTLAWENPTEFMQRDVAEQNDVALSEGNCNVGVLCGKFSDIIGIDIDIDDHKGEGTKFIAALHEALPKTPAIKFGKKGLTLFYKYNNERTCKITLRDEVINLLDDTKAHIDILSDKRQSVIPPSIHPESKQPYTWLDENYILTKSDLPVITDQHWEKFFAVLGTPVPEKIKHAIVGAPKGNQNAKKDGKSPARRQDSGIVHVYQQGAFQNDPTVEALVQHCLKHIPAKCGYDEWVKIGFAINHSITKDKGARIFLEWSKTGGEDYSEDEILNKCRDIFYNTSPINEMQVTFQHLVFEAKKNPDFVVTDAQLKALTVVHSAILANRYDIGDIETVAKQLRSYTVPQDLLDAPIGSQAVHAAFLRQYFGSNIVHSEDGVLIFKETTRQWENATRVKTPDIATGYNNVATYVKSHPQFRSDFVNADGIFSHAKFRAAADKIHSYTYINSVRRLLIESVDCLDKIDNDTLNKHVNILGLADGNKVCLRTGAVSRISPEDYITERATVEVAPPGDYGDAPKILMEALEPEYREYMQMLCGYFISGDVSLKEVYFFVGESGNNGKTFLLDQLLTILGTSNLSARRNASTFMDKSKITDKDSDRRFDGLIGKRVVGISDTAENHIFSADLYKTLTDPRLTYRSLYDKITTAPNHAKFVICCNTLPRLGVMDKATKQRTVCIPFEREFDPSDPKIQAKAARVIAGLPGLLRWMVDGRIKMLENGNSLPKLPGIQEATTRNVMEQDILGEAVAACCFNPSSTTPRTNAEIQACVMQVIKNMEQYRHTMPNIDHMCDPRAIGRKLKAMHFIQAPGLPGNQRGWYVDLKYPEFKQDIDPLMMLN